MGIMKKKNVVRVEFYDPTMVISAAGETGDCIIYTAYGELELYKNKFYFLYLAYPTPPLSEGTKAISFVIPKGSVRSITKLEEHNANNTKNYSNKK